MERGDSSAPGFLCAALLMTIDQRVVLLVRFREGGMGSPLSLSLSAAVQVLTAQNVATSIPPCRRRRPLRMQATGKVQCPIPRTRELRPSVVCWERRGHSSGCASP